MHVNPFIYKFDIFIYFFLVNDKEFKGNVFVLLNLAPMQSLSQHEIPRDSSLPKHGEAVVAAPW